MMRAAARPQAGRPSRWSDRRGFCRTGRPPRMRAARAAFWHDGGGDMAGNPYRRALIVGAGPGIGASVARALAQEGLAVAVAARRPDRLQGLASEIGAKSFAVDA